jgi:hypothetical protein
MRSLPLSHGTKAITLRDILAAGRIELPRDPCQVLKDRLIFTFYARPSYRVNPNAGGLKRPAGAPTYVLLKQKAFDTAKMAYALDTGAFALNLYSGDIESDIRPLDFGFGPSVNDVKKVVYYFFGSNESYMNNLPRVDVNVPNGFDEVQAFYDVISTSGKNDERKSSIEVCLNSAIPLDPDWVQCLIVPDLLAEAENYGIVARGLGIDVRSYRFVPGYRPADYTGRILDAVLQYYREKDLM